MDTNFIISEVKYKLLEGRMYKATLAELQSRLDSLSDKQRSDVFLKIQDAKLKTPLIIFMCNFLVGTLGVGRFMIGDWGIGIGRLALFLIWCVTGALNDGSAEMKIVDMSFAIFVWGWWIVDIFLVDKKVRMQNLRKILQSIDSVKK